MRNKFSELWKIWNLCWSNTTFEIYPLWIVYQNYQVVIWNLYKFQFFTNRWSIKIVIWIFTENFRSFIFRDLANRLWAQNRRVKVELVQRTEDVCEGRFCWKNSRRIVKNSEEIFGDWKRSRNLIFETILVKFCGNRD